MNESELFHYGTPRHSGRYPWGSGKEPYQHSSDFLYRIESLKKEGMTDSDIAKYFELTTTEYRVQKSLAVEERRKDKIETAKRYKEKFGMSNVEIGKKMGINESSVRSLLKESEENKLNQSQALADYIKKQIDERGMMDVGTGVEKELNISREKMNQVLYILERDGYPVYTGGLSQVTNKNQQTIMKVVCPPGTEHKTIFEYDKIHSIIPYEGGPDDIRITRRVDEKGRPVHPETFQYPSSLDSKRVLIKYKEDGGIEKDGLIEIRRGVKDISLGDSHYAQCRILVDDNFYMKGMAIYKDDMPPGVDVIFNTNKTKGTPKEKVFKPIKSDPENPFGSLISPSGQSYYYDENGKQHLSKINKRAKEGDWNKWSKDLPAQFLSKQDKSLVKRQLDISIADKKAQYEEICNLTNPSVKKALLKEFSDTCDGAAIHLKAAALPRQRYQVLIPIPEMKDTEVYAPNFKNGEKVALIRFPHGGRFEIPILTVNNKQKNARKVLEPTAEDAIGINSKVAERLSGADFDGDATLVIPIAGTKIRSQHPLKELEGFDPKTAYPAKPGMRIMKATGMEMGKISNLITDMTLKGATDDELARAVKHSMVVIDAEKHKLDYKQSEIDNDIKSLKIKYQSRIDENGNIRTGAGTLISRAKSPEDILKRKGTPKINIKGKPYYDPTKPEGALLYKSVVEEYKQYKKDKNGNIKLDENGNPIFETKTRMQRVTKMANTDDAYTLSSGHPIENLYAEYANAMKALANQCRKEMVMTKNIPYSKQAKEKYIEQVKSLNAKLNVAEKNAPRERQAQLLANSIIKMKKKDNPDMTKEEIKKASQQALVNSRLVVGAKRRLVEITDKEWEAIQNGAISPSKLDRILAKSDMNILKELAMPKNNVKLLPAKINKLKIMYESGYTIAEISEALGVSISTIHEYMKGK